MRIKKFLVGLLLCLTAGLSAFAFAGCENDDESNSSQTPPTSVQGGLSNENGESAQLTVTYDANGGAFENGENTLTQTVSTNSSLTAPTSPKRTNYTFAGWATDKNGGTAWVFDTDKPTGNVTLYAVWREIITEYDITFVLNYANAENVVKSTENGLITYIPARDNYVFNGWWLSDGETENGYILSQKYDTSQRVSESNLTLYAEWVEEATASAQLLAPSVSINENTFSWNAITGAQSYNIRIYESGNNEALYNQSTTATSWTFPSSYEGGYYSVKIRANGDGETTVNSVFATKSYAHRILNAISTIDFDISKSVLTWTAVRYATEYELYLNNTFVDIFEQTIFDMSEYQAGEYEVKIIATRNDYQSSTTKKAIEKKRLKTPEITVQINDENNSYDFSWDTIYNANLYILTLNGKEIRLTDCVYSLDNPSTAWNGENTITYSIKAFDESADYLVSNPSNEQMLNKIYFLNVVETFGDNEQTFKMKHFIPNEEVTITATPKTGYTFLGWYDEKTELTDEINYTFEMTAENVTYTAKWERTDLLNFIYQRTDDGIEITGIKDKMVDAIYVPDDVVSIREGAFSGCSSLTSITLPFVGAKSGLIATGISDKYIGVECLFGYIFGTTPYVGGTSLIQCYYFKGNVTADKIYYRPTSLQSVMVTGGIIFEYAFSGVDFLKNMIIGDDIVLVSGNTGGVLPYNVADSLKYLGNENNPYLCLMEVTTNDITTAKIKDGCKVICGSAFSRCSQLSEVKIPNSVTFIGDDAFEECKNLESITIRGNSVRIDYGAFSGCESLASVILSEGVTSIGAYAFSDCTSLSSITLPSSVKYVGNNAFARCKTTLKIYIKGSVENWNVAWSWSDGKHYSYIQI